jgi:hypothetical protein
MAALKGDKGSVLLLKLVIQISTGLTKLLTLFL